MAKKKTTEKKINAREADHYWAARVKNETNEKLQATQKEAEELLKKLYREQSEEIVNELNRIFMKIMSDKKSGEIMMNDLFRTKAMNEILDAFNRKARELGSEEIKITEKALIDCYKQACEAVDKYVPKDKPINTSFSEPDEADLRNVVHQVWVLNKDGVGEEFSSDIWKNKQNLVIQMQKSLSDAVGRGESPLKIAQEVADTCDSKVWEAYRLVRTETAHQAVSGQVDRYTKKYGFKKGIWDASNCACDECKSRDKKPYDLEELRYELPAHPNCMCCFLLDVGGD